MKLNKLHYDSKFTDTFLLVTNIERFKFYFEIKKNVFII